MGKRVTIVLDKINETRLRKIQADQIKNTSDSISFSKVINQTLEIGLKK
ncbi:MAG: hypothetical protein ACE5DL_00440 [Nitrosopumilaceae archaeon]